FLFDCCNRQLQQQLQQSNKKEQNATTIQAQAEYVPKQEMADGKERTNDHFDFPPIPIATEDKVETSIESQVFQMHQKGISRSEEHTSELQSRFDLVCRLLLEKKKNSTT